MKSSDQNIVQIFKLHYLRDVDYTSIIVIGETSTAWVNKPSNNPGNEISETRQRQLHIERARGTSRGLAGIVIGIPKYVSISDAGM